MIHPVRAREVITRWLSASPATRVGGPVAALLLGISGLWTTRPVVVVSRTATITEVLLWWEQPDYLAVRLN